MNNHLQDLTVRLAEANESIANLIQDNYSLEKRIKRLEEKK